MRYLEYKQFKKYFNEKFNNYKKIENVSKLNISYYNPFLNKTNSIEEMLKRPKRYYFNVVVPTNSKCHAKQETYYYDSKQEAEQEYKKAKLQFYDQLTKPYLEKIDAGKKLCDTDIKKIYEIIDSF